jgi:beta-glucanase (GH16 family)
MTQKITFIAIFLLLATFGAKAQTLVWEDNFNAATINTTTWTNDLGDGCDIGICGWGNSELEYYTNSLNNAYISSGNLVIEARREASNGKPFTSARLKTKGLMQFKYGTVEARIKIPNVTDGLWPAFWTLGSVGAAWPAIGEIDMMEIGSASALQAGLGNKRVTSAAHWSNATGAHEYNLFSTDAAVDLSADYHIYKMVWTSQSIKMFLDGVEYYTFDISGGAAANLSEFHNPHYLLLNLAVGGSYTGKMTDASVTATLPGKMYIDYVRLYQNPGDELYVATNATTPTAAAPVPTCAPADATSLFSNTYTNVPVSSWSPAWDQADVADVQIAGNDAKLYTNLNYAIVDFPSIDATTKTHFNIDVWTANSTTLKVKLVDFGANGAFGGGDDKEHEVVYTPTLGAWTSLKIPLSDFTGLTTRSKISQIVISGSANSTMYIDNVFFCFDSTLSPTTAAPTPTKGAACVTSLFSNAYTNVGVDTWSASWDNANVADVQIGGNATKLYTDLVFAGVEFTGANVINATDKTHLHLDVWTANSATFKVKLVDIGANAAFGGGDDSEHELTLSPTLGAWTSYDIPFTDFTSLTARAHLAQMIFVGTNSKVYIDNVYFHKVCATAPTTAAPTPTKTQANVISLFSNPYTNVPVDTWSTSWDVADVADVQIAGNDTKLYTNLAYAGIEFLNPTINPTTMNVFHIDIWTPNSTTFKVKLVDFGANNAYGGGDDAEQELTFTPALNTWVSYDIPLTSFPNLAGRTHLAQLIISGSAGSTMYVDNVLFCKSNAPLVAAPTPTKAAANVVSLFSNAYTNVPVQTWSAGWDNADFAEVQIAGNDTKLYTNLVFAGVEFTNAANQLDATTFTVLHLDVWTPDATSFKVKLVDFGANGIYDGGDDTAHEFTLAPPTLGGWSSYDIPMSSFTGLTTRAHLAQLLFVSDNKTAYIDNVYFCKPGAIPTAPTTAAPTPTMPQSKVISLFSNAYTNVPVNTWSAVWDQADVADVQVATNATKLYTNLQFAGVEFTSAVINATDYTHLHVDVWTPNATSFSVKLVDFGANGVYQGTINDDSAHELALAPPTLGTWVSYDILLSDFTGLAARAHLAQMLFVSSNSTVYIDNVYFYNMPAAPATAAPTPTVASANVTSLFSNTYTNVTVGSWSASWDDADVADVQIAGNDTKLYTNLKFAGVDFSNNQLDVTAKTHFHIDIWTGNSSVFKIKLVDFGANRVYQGTPNDDTEHELTFTPALCQWVSYDIPLTDFVGLTARAHLAQMILVGSNSKVYMDNAYFYRNSTLPVALTTFSGIAKQHTTLLNWTTASESNNQAFIVERSANATDYTAIGQVQGNGTTNIAHNYTFTDEKPLGGINYYRLRQMDADGKATISTAIAVLFSTNSFMVTNTLVHDVLNISTDRELPITINIFNISGQPVYTGKLQGSQQLNLSDLTSGLYIIRTSEGDAIRFIKE